MRSRFRGLAGVAAVAGVLAVGVGPAAAIPPGFTDTLVADVAAPTAVAFTPDGRLLITTQTGALRVYAGGSLLPMAAITLAVCSNSERGLLGVAVDPAFALNRAIYLYYTARVGSSCVNRVSRFTLSDANVVDPASELVLIDNIPSPAGNHNGGDLEFGKDGNLYVSIGDGGCDYAPPNGCGPANDAARDEFILLGKILRITPNGGIPSDNPFQGAGTGRCNVTGRTTAARCQETFAWGLRNPFRFAFDPNAAGTRFYVNDVGQGTWEEIDLGQAGADYGWNVREGFCARGSPSDCGPPPAGMTNPIYAYSHSSGCRSITGGAFVPNGVWPAEYDGDYLYSDFVCGRIFRLEPSGAGFAATEFTSGLGVSSAVHMRFGPWGTSQALYYTTYASGGEIRRIAYTAGSPSPQPPPPSPTPPPPSPTPPPPSPTPPSPPAPPPAPPPPPSPPAGVTDVRITAIRYDAAGIDARTRRSLNGEWVRIRNFGTAPAALTGWSLADRQGHVYRFGRYALAPGAWVTVHTGAGRNSAAHRYWGRRSHVWGNTRDRATLRTRFGVIVDRCAYANARADFARC